MSDRAAIVFSTGLGSICPGCRRPQAGCVCKTAAGQKLQPKGGAVRVLREKQGRAGKVVSVITGLPLDAAQRAALASELKRRCGAGGAVAGDNIEIQGDHRDTLVAELCRRGFEAKKSGG